MEAAIQVARDIFFLVAVSYATSNARVGSLDSTTSSHVAGLGTVARLRGSTGDC